MTSTATTWRARSLGIFRHSDRDAVLVALALLHGVLLVTVPSIPLVAIGLWWNANTIAHHFIHRPFFRAKWANQAFSAALTLLLGVPQRLWRERHLAHHANRPGATGADARRGPRTDAAVRGLGAVRGRRAGDLLPGLPARLGRRPGTLRASGSLRARGRDDEPLRPALQSALFQRRLSRRAPRAARTALDRPRRPPHARGARQPMAAGAALARRLQPVRPGAPGGAIAAAAAIRRRSARNGDAAPDRRRASCARHRDWWRPVSAHGLDRGKAVSARARHAGGCERAESRDRPTIHRPEP